MIKRLLNRVFGRKAAPERARVEVHVHAKEERHFEIVPQTLAEATAVEKIPDKPKKARKRTKATAKTYPAKPKATSRKKSNAKKTPARKKSR